MAKYYVGLATTFHDPGMAVVDETGTVLFAEASERYLQVKRAFCAAADNREMVRRVLRQHCDPQGEFVVAKPWSGGFTRFLELNALIGAADHERFASRGGGITRFLVDSHVLFSSLWLQHTAQRVSGGHVADILINDFGNTRVRYVRFRHHLAHAASACFTSPFEEAVCAVIDGQGESGPMSFFRYEGGRLTLLKEMKGTASLGILYSICTDIAGFRSEAGEEWKLMGLAAYGTPQTTLLDEFRELISVDDLTLRYPKGRRLRAVVAHLRRHQRPADKDSLTMADFAASIQAFYSEVATGLLRSLHARGLSDNLVIGGGCGLNSSYNGQVVGLTGFKRLHVPSAPGDDGNALGCALLACYRDHPDLRPAAKVHSPYLGSSISRRTLENFVRFGRLPKTRHLPGSIHRVTAELLAAGKLVGWVQGRAEFGPRALGNRSILADPRPADMKDRINSLVKFREEFRPFAPAVLDECGPEYFENYQVSPYMERTLRFTEAARTKVPAIVHVNMTGRLQSVRREWNERFYDLIREFQAITGVPMLLNTSFNIMGKPIVHSLEDAIGVFFTTGLDALVVEDYLIEK